MMSKVSDAFNEWMTGNILYKWIQIKIDASDFSKNLLFVFHLFLHWKDF